MGVTGPQRSQQPVIDELQANQAKQNKRSKNPVKWIGRRVSLASNNAKTGYTSGVLKGLRQIMLGSSHKRFRDQPFTSILARSPLFIPGAVWGILRGVGEGAFGIAKGLFGGKPHDGAL